MHLTDIMIENICCINSEKEPPYLYIVDYYNPIKPKIILDKPLIENFDRGYLKVNKISSGVSSAGYDMRLSGEKMYEFVPGATYIDPKRFKDIEYSKIILREIYPEYVTGKEEKVFYLKPHSYYLGSTIEYFNMPSRIIGDCIGKSTYARSGILVNLTPLEPSWRGNLTLEIANLTPLPAILYPGEGIAQVKFSLLPEEPNICYKKKAGIYQNQVDITTSRVRE